jgi:hypothetical protein
MKPTYHTLNQLIDMIEEPNGSICHRVLDENKELFRIARGSSHNHQAWEGGYLDHLTEIMNTATVLYSALNETRPLPFSLSDSLLVLYLHDLEKPWRYIKQEDGLWKMNPDLADKGTQVGPFVDQKISEYGFVLTDSHLNGLKYVEGEKNDYSPTRRTQTPLAAFAHLCDTWSARGWFNFPAESNDPWTNAYRGRH